jgi:UDP-glucuronate 4-epimerase
MKTILVTGGAGFIGSHVIDHLLAKGDSVINIDNFNDFYDKSIKESNIIGHLNYNKTYRLIREDVSNKQFLYNSLKKYKFDAIIHLAARAGVRPSIENPHQYFIDNVIGTQNILDYAKDHNIKNVVMASSSSVYGNNKKTPFSETDSVDNPISPYATTKKTNELQAYTYHHLFGLKFIILRFFTVYGPRQRPYLAIHKFIDLISKGKSIPFYGDGNTSRDYTYIDDIVKGILGSLNYLFKHSNVYEIVNLGNNKPVNLAEMVRTIEKVINKKAIFNVLPLQPGDVQITYADIAKARKLLNYIVETSFDFGVIQFWNWYKSYVQLNKKHIIPLMK